MLESSEITSSLPSSDIELPDSVLSTNHTDEETNGEMQPAHDTVDRDALIHLESNDTATGNHSLTHMQTLSVKKEEGVPHARLLGPSISSCASLTSSSLSTCSNGKHIMLPAFLSKTYEIFNLSEFHEICGWNTLGDTIIVRHLEAFVATVLPRFFKHRNFPSFVRQLNLYGFHKTVLDSKRLEFQHPYFKRNRPDLLHLIKRKVSTPSASSSTQLTQSSLTASVQNNRFEAHREISDTLLKEMKQLRQRSETMEKRLREIEIDNAIVRSDNLKLWKHLEAAKDKQLIMQEKMKKIMWVLFQIYRGKRSSLPKLANSESDTYSEDSVLGPKEFRDVLRFLAMDEPHLLAQSSTDTMTLSKGSTSRKRKFIEVGNELNGLTLEKAVERIKSQEASKFQENFISSLIRQDSLMGIPNANTALSLFPHIEMPRDSKPSDENPGSDLWNSTSSEFAAEIKSTEITEQDLTTSSPSPSPATVTSGTHEEDNSEVGQLDFIDQELPLLGDTENYVFSEGEEQVMKRLEDFETSLLDEYDVNCLDTLLQQIKQSGPEKAAHTQLSDDGDLNGGFAEEKAISASL